MNEMYHLFAGVTAGTVSTVLLHPLDLIKVRMQVHEGAFGAYRGVWSALTEIFQREGLRGLYAGLSPAVLASALSWGGYFFFYEHSKVRASRAPVVRSFLLLRGYSYWLFRRESFSHIEGNHWLPRLLLF